MAVIVPPQAYAITFNDISFWIRMEKLVEKLWKHKDKKEGNKIIDTLLEIKMEVESYTGIPIDLDKEFSKARSDIKKQGGKVPKKDFEKVRKAIKKKEKRLYHRNMCVAAYLEDAPNISFQNYETFYMAACNAHDRDEEEQEAKDLPWRLAVGVSMILGGGFLVVAGTLLKIPLCIEAGRDLAAGGVFFAVEGYHDGQEEKKDKNNK